MKKTRGARKSGLGTRKPATQGAAERGERKAEDQAPTEERARDPFTVMRVVVPASQKEFVYERARVMRLDTPSAYVRLVLKNLKEEHEEFEFEKNGFGAYDDEPGTGSARPSRGQGRSTKRARGRRR